MRIVNPSLAELDPQLPEEIANQSPIARAWRAFERALDQRHDKTARYRGLKAREGFNDLAELERLERLDSAFHQRGRLVCASLARRLERSWVPLTNAASGAAGIS